jgi:hypothetical protein
MDKIKQPAVCEDYLVMGVGLGSGILKNIQHLTKNFIAPNKKCATRYHLVKMTKEDVTNQ